MPEPFLRFERLTHAYGTRTILRNISGSIESGELLLIEGHNGSGKSTLIRCLAGLQRERSGTIDCSDGDRLLDRDARRAAVGWVGPDLSFYEALTAAENLAFFARLRGIDPRAGLGLLQQLGIPPERLVGALSSGMLQRVRWAFALQHEPPLLLLDEPFQNLDAVGTQDTRDLLARHLTAGRMAVVASPVELSLPVRHRLRLGDQEPSPTPAPDRQSA